MHLKLFVSHRFHDDVKAEEAVQRLTEELFLAGHDPEIEIIDVTKEPQKADEWKILATPTLVRTDRLPQIRVISGLENITQLVGALTREPAQQS